jgi:hypothetical protein
MYTATAQSGVALAYPDCEITMIVAKPVRQADMTAKAMARVFERAGITI